MASNTHGLSTQSLSRSSASTLASARSGRVAKRAVGNVSGSLTVSNGFLTVYPDGATRPDASNLNWAPGETLPNLVLATPSADAAKTVDFYNAGSGKTDLVVDLFGFFGTY
jgi:hypothetical protein